jgi:transcriptional regulator with XRE-family HTH domain
MPIGRAATAEETIAHVAANVRQLRLRRGLSQEALAELVDVPPLRIQRVERGQADVRVGLLVAFASALDVPLPRLFRAREPVERAPGRPPQKKRRSAKR